MENADLNSLWYYDLDPKYSPDSAGIPQPDFSPCSSCTKKQTELEQEQSTNEELIRHLADITREKAALRSENAALKARLLNLEHGGGVAQPPPPEPGDSGGGVASTPSPSAHARALRCSPSPSSSGPTAGENGGPAAAPPSVKPKPGGFNEESAHPRSDEACASSPGPDKTGSSAVEDRGASKSSVAWRCECGGVDTVASETAIANGNGAGARRTAAALAVANLGSEGAPHERIVCPVLKMTKHLPSEALAEVAKVAESVKRAQEVTPATASAKFAAAISLNSEGSMMGGRDANQMDVDNADGSGDLGQKAGRYSSKGGVMQAASRERPEEVETRADAEENMRGKAGERGSAAAPSSSTAGPSLVLSTPSSVGSTSMAGSVGGQSPVSTAGGLESGREEAAARAPPATATTVTPTGGSYTPTTVTLSAKVAFVGGVTRRNIRSGEDSGYTPKEDDPFTTRHMHVLQCFLCGRFPTTQRDSRAVVFCSICPRKACLLCQETRISRDRSDWTQGKDTFGRFFEIPKCRACQKGVDDRIPPERLVGAAPLPPVTAEDMEESIGRFLDWLQNHDLAHFFVDDVDPEEYPEYPKKVKTPMNIGRMRKRLAAREYLGLGGDTQLMDDIDLILTNCVLFNGELAAISRAAAIFKNRAEKYIRIHMKPIVERWLSQRGNGVNGSPPAPLTETLERAPRDRINRNSSSPSPPDNLTSAGEATGASGIGNGKRKISSSGGGGGDSGSISSNVGKVVGGEAGRAALATSPSPPNCRRLRLMGSQPSGVLFSPGPAAISGAGSANDGSERGASKSVFDIDMDEGDEDAEWFDVRGSRAGIKTRGAGRAGSARGGRARGVDLQIERALASEEVDGSGNPSTAVAVAAAYRPRPSSGRANPYKEIADALKLVGLPTGSKRS